MIINTILKGGGSPTPPPPPTPEPWVRPAEWPDYDSYCEREGIEIIYYTWDLGPDYNERPTVDKPYNGCYAECNLMGSGVYTLGYVDSDGWHSYGISKSTEYDDYREDKRVDFVATELNDISHGRYVAIKRVPYTGKTFRMLKFWHTPNTSGTARPSSVVEIWGRMPNFAGHLNISYSRNLCEVTESFDVIDVAPTFATACKNLFMTGEGNGYKVGNVLQNINFSGWDFSNCTTIEGMFNGCYNLKYIDTSNWNLSSKITSMSATFKNCYLLESLDLTNFDFSNVTTIQEMFSGCRSLKYIDTSSWNVSSTLTNMNATFYVCVKIESLDLTNFDFSNVNDMKYTFYGCKQLKDIQLNSNINFNELTTFYGAFQEAAALEEFEINGCSFPKLTTCQVMFRGCTLLEKVKIENCTAPLLNNISSLFNNCVKLTDVSFSGTYFPRVQNAGGAFSSCYFLKHCDLSFLIGAQPIQLDALFANCYILEEADLSMLDLSKTTTLNSAFKYCHDLKSISWPTDLAKTTLALTDMGDCLTQDFGLREIDLSTLDLSHIANGKFTGFQGTSKANRITLGSGLQNITSLTFADRSNKKTIIDMSLCDFTSLTTLTLQAGIISLGHPKIYRSFNISSTSMGHDAIMELINGLPTVSGQTLTMGSAKLALLSATEKAVATGKGWSLA